MRTISIRLNDDDYEALDKMLDSMGQTKQSFYESYTKTALREQRIPFIIRATYTPTPNQMRSSKMEAFEKLEAIRKTADQYTSQEFDPEKELEAALDEKYGHID